MRALPAGCLRIQEIDHAPNTTAARPQSRASANPDMTFSLSRRDVQVRCNGLLRQRVERALLDFVDRSHSGDPAIAGRARLSALRPIRVVRHQRARLPVVDLKA